MILYLYTWFQVRVGDYFRDRNIETESVLRDVDITEEAAKLVIGD